MAYGGIASLAPHCATGMTGALVSSATRAAPVLPCIGHMVGVAGEGALGVEGHAFALVDGVDGGAEGVGGVGGLAVDGDLAGAAQHRADEAALEEAGLGEESRDPPGVVLEVRIGERVEIRVVVDRGDKSAVGRNVLHSLPVPLEQNHERRFADDRGQAVPEADSAAGHSDTLLVGPAELLRAGSRTSVAPGTRSVEDTVTPTLRRASGGSRREWRRCEETESGRMAAGRWWCR